jgi:hypothetical protein
MLLLYDTLYLFSLSLLNFFDYLLFDSRAMMIKLGDLSPTEIHEDFYLHVSLMLCFTCFSFSLLYYN